jgi:hypothetical protein
VPDTPHYPRHDSGSVDEPDPGRRPRSRGSTLGLWIAGAAVLVLFVVLHLTGVLGPGGH